MRYRMFRCTLLVGILLLIVGGCSSGRQFSKAQKKYKIGEYHAAADHCKRALRGERNKKKKAEVSFLMGKAYQLSNQERRAVAAFRKAIANKYPDPEVLFYYGEVLRQTKRFKEAKEAYRAYLELSPDNVLAYNGIESCKEAPRMMKQKTPYKVNRVKTFNSRRGDMCPCFGGKDYGVLYFATTRDGVTGNKTSAVSGQKYYDIFVSKKNAQGKWSAPESIGETINTEFDEGVVSVSQDGKSMYYTFCKMDPLAKLGANICEVKRTGAKWGEPVVLPIGADSLVSAHPAISPDETTLYFVSDMEGGIGGKDIWKVERLGGEWGQPVNMGSEINTPGDEMFPQVRKDGSLYFSSNGHIGLGGLDIFKASQDEDGLWVVENLGYPVNSCEDDFGITFEGEREKGFFTSNRDDGRGYDHIWSFEKPELVFWMEGVLRDEKLKEPLDKAYVRIVGNDGTNVRIRTKEDGKFKYRLKKGTDYVLLFTCKEFLNKKGDVSTMFLTKNKTFDLDVKLVSIKKPIQLTNIFYDFGKWELRAEATQSLDSLVQILNDNPNITIELGSHTDNVGSDVTNLTLSQKRAQGVVDYLVTKGIASDRLVPKGYGETKPVVVDAHLSKKYSFLKEGDILDGKILRRITPYQRDEMNQINRRTEFRVLRTDYKRKK